MAESKQTFEGGLSMDLSQAFAKKSTYIDALNVDIFLNEINGSIALTNSKGNKLQIQIPQTESISNWSVGSGTSTLILGNRPGVLWDSSGKDTFDLYNFIKNIINADISAGYVNLYYNEGSVVIVQNPSNPFPGGNYSKITYGSGVVDNIRLRVDKVSVHYPIGFCTIHDDIYIITTGSNSQSVGGPGFFWKLSYNKETFNPLDAKIELIYGAQLNMSTYYNIPPTAIVGRYETDVIKKIYFTDFYNPLRSINVADPNIMAEDPKTFSASQDLILYKPIFVSLSDGGSTPLHSGVYQSYYKLLKNLGNESSSSFFSTQISVGATAMSSPYQDYVGGTSSTPKEIKWVVNNIDTNYDVIEFYVVVRETDDNGVGSGLYKVASELINGASSRIFIVNQDSIDNSLPITLSEAASGQYNGFTHCKTIAEKDNMLIAGNLKNSSASSSISFEFDARAFRANSNGTINVYNNGVLKVYNTLASAIASPESDDNFNDYSKPSACYAVPGALSTLGGAGKNISYTFITQGIPADDNVGTNSAYAPFFTCNKTKSMFSFGVKSPNFIQSYDSANDDPAGYYGSYKNPLNSGILKGYMRGETYRFAIQFYSKTMEPLFAKWIGDIKFPNHFDIRPAIPGVPGDFRTFVTTSYGQGLVQTLGIKFTVKGLDLISDKIGGYSIVRVDRKYSDKTILNQGFGLFMQQNTYQTGGLFNNVTHFVINPSLFPSGSNVIGLNFTFKFPRIGYSGKTVSSGSFIEPIYDIESVLSSVDTQNADIMISDKMYSLRRSVNYGISTEIIQSAYTDGTETKSSSAITSTIYNRPVVNRSFGFSSINKNQELSYSNQGQPSYYIETKQFFNSIGGIFIANNTVKNNSQYGGGSYSNRSLSTYISCGHFRPIPNNTVADPVEEFEVYGGDTFICLYDSATFTKDWTSQNVENDFNVTYRFGQTHIVPLESDINVDLMGPERANTTLTKNYNDNHIQFRESGSYFTAYSASDDIVSFFPKPQVFFEVNKWENRMAHSNVKTNGELIDSWSDFTTSHVYDVDGSYGPINSIIARSSKIYYFQDKAFGIIQINPRSLISDQSTPGIESQIQLGLGVGFQRHDYISNITGTKHQGSVINTVSGLYWVDTNNKKIFRFSESSNGALVEPISDTKGLFAYLSKNFNNSLEDKPCFENGAKSGISSTYDVVKKMIYYTFHNLGKSFTLGYNELTNSFISFYSFTPNMYISDSNNIFTIKDSSVYVQDKGEYGDFYGSKEESIVKFVVNDNPDKTKMFGSVSMITQSINNGINQTKDTWNYIRIDNDYQDTGDTQLIYNDNIKRVERVWKLAVPRNRMTYDVDRNPLTLSSSRLMFGDRIRDNYINIKLRYSNSNNNLLKTSVITTYFEESPR